MNDIYADLHIHIGRTFTGRPVKITGSKSLTLKNIIQYACQRKGLQMIGVIDCHSPEVLYELEEMVKRKELIELTNGGLHFKETTLILGTEIEIMDQNCHGPIHVLAYFPTLHKMREFSEWLSHHVKNIHLSTQRIYVEGKTLQKKVRELEGIFVPAHVFTPFKSLYGKGVKYSLTEVFDADLIDAIELGLSSDTEMVKNIEEINCYSFLTNSDAHSLGKIAREYQKITVKAANFQELKKALHKEDGRGIAANYGLNPLLGKYYQTVCSNCSALVDQSFIDCPHCHHTVFIKGVSKRIQELSHKHSTPIARPPYIHQIPLDYIPGLGPKTLNKLIEKFGTEMVILHETTEEELSTIVSQKIAHLIHEARSGKLNIASGGGGRYGKIIEKL